MLTRRTFLKFSGAGTLAISLENPTGPAAPAKYMPPIAVMITSRNDWSPSTVCSRVNISCCASGCVARLEAAQLAVAVMVASNTPVYGVNTGFGKLASVRIAPDDVAGVMSSR